MMALAAPQTSELDQSIQMLERLDSMPFTAEYRDESLAEVIDDLNGHLPVPLRADWESMERLGVRRDDRVTLRLNPTVVSSVLAALVMTLGDDFERPVIEAHAGQIVLTTLQGTAAMRMTEIYDVRDLLANTSLMKQLREQAPASESEPPATQPQPAEPPDHAPLELPQRAFGRQRAGDKPILPQPHFDDEGAREPAPLTPGERLYMLITDHVDPEAWMNFGGDRARVSDSNGVLMVTATPSVHRSFRAALAALRRANPTSIEISASIVDLPRATYEQLSRQTSTSSAVFAGSILHAGSAKLIWQTSAGVALGARLDVESAADSMSVRVVLSPTMDQSAGLLNVGIEASTQAASDQRRVKTTLALTADQGCALIELAPAKPNETVRLLVLAPQRH